MDDGSGLIGLLALALIVGLIIRNRGDNTMDTLSKGCGCLITGFIILIIAGVLIQIITV
jgi:H+/gluconate symporter-like permease|tara:strand:- start:113 stop:289 length:177 start_codon:yes stop_codon:yes gene_type:complete